MTALAALSLAGLVAICRPAAATLGGASVNPFLDQHFYINPVNAREYESTIATASGTVRSNLQKMQRVPSAYWIDQQSKIRGETTTTVEGILKDASSKTPPELVVLMFYDLPNRDCDAKASNGEICCKKNPDGTCDYLAPGDCAEGIEEYKSGYVDPFVSVLSEYDGKVPVVLVMEPDGLGNLATNIAHPHCGNMATQTAYKQGVKYAVEQITAKAPSVSLYLDAAHGGWLGWENNLEKFMSMLKELSLPFDKIRGFATNVANYQALGVQCPWCPDQGFRNGYCMNGKHSDDPCCEDPCGLIGQWNFGNNELNYAAGLVAAANSVLGFDARVIIDTGRNGVADQRQDCANWCNPRGAGAGVPSTTDTANTSLVDAYFWLKTPGESDGCSETLPDGKKCPRFDSKCASVDSLGVQQGEEAAPEAGMWYDFQVKQLAENARFEPPEAKASATCPASAGSAQPITPPMVMMPPSSWGAGGNGFSAGMCAGAYQQCGGVNFMGARCCHDGCQCVENGGYYSQCTPLDPSAGGVCRASGTVSSQVQTVPATPAASAGAAGLRRPSAPAMLPTTLRQPVPAPAPSMPASAASAVASNLPAPAPAPLARTLPASTTAAQPARMMPAPATPSPAPAPWPAALPFAQPAPAPQQCAVAYGQCGGSSWTGPTCCDVYCTCQVVDASRSQCVPRSGAFAGSMGASRRPMMFQSSPVAVVLKDELHGGQKHFSPAAAAGVAPWAALPLALALLALLAGLARSQWRRPSASYAALGVQHQQQESSALP